MTSKWSSYSWLNEVCQKLQHPTFMIEDLALLKLDIHRFVSTIGMKGHGTESHRQSFEKFELVLRNLTPSWLFQGICWPWEKCSTTAALSFKTGVLLFKHTCCVSTTGWPFTPCCGARRSVSHHIFDYSNLHVIFTETIKKNLNCKYEGWGDKDNTHCALHWHSDTKCSLLIGHECFFHASSAETVW